MQIQCPACGTTTSAEGTDLPDRIARCRTCNEIFELPESSKRTQKQGVTQPPSIEIVESAPAEAAGGYRESKAEPGTLVLVYRWRDAGSVFRLAVGLLVFGVFVYQGHSFAVADDGAMLLVLLPSFAIGIALLYQSAAQIVNQTTIRISDGRLRVKHGPLPWRGAASLSTRAITRLFVRRDRHSGRHSGYSTYAVCADTGVAVDLVKSLRTEAEARFIEQTIEAHLRIEDEPPTHRA